MAIRIGTPEGIVKELREESEELLKIAKLPRELLVKVRGTVASVKGYSESMSHTPMSEMMIGGRSPHYQTGLKYL